MSIFDAHLHIIDPAYPLIENQGYLPELFSVQDYLKRVRPLGIQAGAVVSGSFQGFDQDYLVSALNALGDRYVGVTQVPSTITDEALSDLHEAGVRAVRFNVFRGGSESVNELESMAERVFDMFGWHVELYVGSVALRELKDRIKGLPKVSIDHLGLQSDGLSIVKELIDCGVYVKATGFGRVDFDPFLVVKDLFSINPERLVFGTDLPCTRAPQPFQDAHLYQLQHFFSEAEAEKLLWKNALELYNLSSVNDSIAD